MKTLPIILAIALAGTTAACGGGPNVSAAIAPSSTADVSHGTSPTSSSQTSNAGQQYLALIVPVNSAVKAFVTWATAHPNATNADLAEQGKPVIAAIATFSNAVLRLPATGQTATDIRTQVQNAAVMSADIQNFGNNPADNGSTFTTDASKLASASAAVRADLGLPPAS